MKLKDDYILYNASEEEFIAIATGDETDNFNGLLRANKTAGGDEEEIRNGIEEVLETLRSVDALEE